jgi:hypothetical protein
VVLAATFSVIGYNGELVQTLIQKTFTFDPTVTHVIPFSIPREQYQAFLEDDNLLQSNLFARVLDENGNYTGQYFTQVFLC